MLNHDSELESLRTRCEGSLSLRYKCKDRERAKSRLDRELSLIERQGHCAAFCLLAEIGRFVVAQEDAPCQLVGAGPNSILAYLFVLSDIDPLRYQLPAERLLLNQTMNFVVSADSEYAERIKGFVKDQTGFDKVVQISPATHLQRIPQQVAMLIRQKHDPKLYVRNIPSIDGRTAEGLGTGDMTGIFQLESEELRQAARTLKPHGVRAFSALIAANHIDAGREGVLHEFIERCQRDHQAAESRRIISEFSPETRGLLLYQEQIMLLLSRLGAIPLADGYEFIKLAAKRRNIDRFRERFLISAVNKGLSGDEAEDLFEEIATAACDAVCKAHHLTIALTTWRSAYLKANFPNEFSQVIGQI